MERIDKEVATSLGKELFESAKTIAQKYNLKVIPKGGRYSNTHYLAKVEFKVEKINGVPCEQVEFEKHCELFGLKKEDYKKVFTFNGDSYTITGIKLRANKNNIIITKVSTGKRYVLSSETLLKHLN